MRIFAFAAFAALVACSSSSADTLGSSGGATSSGGESDAGPARDGSAYDSAPSPTTGLGTLRFTPDHVYTGTDGTHTFQVPVAVYDFDTDLEVTASDTSAVTIAKATLQNPTVDGVTDNGQYFLVTVQKAGELTLTATSKGRTATATVTITAYDAASYAVGQARYEQTGTGADRPCTTCHAGAGAVDHSPAALATATDQEVGIIITTGVKPGPNVIRIPSEPSTPHKWDVTDAQKDGLITYLRGLTPRGFSQ